MKIDRRSVLGLMGLFVSGRWDELGNAWESRRKRTVTTTIGQGTSHDSSIVIRSIKDDWYEGNILEDCPDLCVGDAIWDGGEKFLITWVEEKRIAVEHPEGLTLRPGRKKTTRYYSGSSPLTDWEADLSSDLYGANDSAVGELHNDGAITDSIDISIDRHVTLRAADTV